MIIRVATMILADYGNCLIAQLNFSTFISFKYNIYSKFKQDWTLLYILKHKWTANLPIRSNFPHQMFPIDFN